jgi:hypothetical protein
VLTDTLAEIRDIPEGEDLKAEEGVDVTDMRASVPKVSKGLELLLR